MNALPASSASPASPRPLDVELLSIGDELLYGDITDTNQVYLAQELRALGLAVRWMQTVGDDWEAIGAAFRLACSRARVVLASGGLGPTRDDRTVEALARFLGAKLEYRDEVMEQMAARLKRPKEQFSESNRKQAYLPEGAAVLRNDWGTAPGVRASTPDERHIFLMPGVPREMKGLFQTWIVPFLKEHFPARQVIAKKHLHLMGRPESKVGEALDDLMRAGRNPGVGTRVNGGIVSVRLVARAGSAAEAEALLAPDVARLREMFREHLFGEDGETLAEAVAKVLLERKRTLAVAESCTAGLIAATLGSVPGISASFKEGAVVYSNEAKQRACGVPQGTLAEHGAVSAPTAKALAEGIRRRAGVDLGLSVTGIAGPGGGTTEKPVGLVYFGLASEQGTQVEQRNLTGRDRNTFRERATCIALDLLRRAAARGEP